MKYRFLLFAIILSFEEIFAQGNFSDCLEDILEGSDENYSEDLYTELNNIYENKIDINGDSLDILLTIPCISYKDIQMIREYICNNGRIIVINELKLIVGISENKYNILKHFVKVKPNNFYSIKIDSSFLHNSTQNMIVRFKRDFKSYNAAYLGNMNKILLKYRIEQFENITAGFTSEKDAGEETIPKNYYGLDFNSAFIQLKELGIIKQINIGDFTANWGQGLISNLGFGCFKSSSSIAYTRSSKLLQKYSSSNEYLFYRGIGLILSPVKRLKIVPFYSKRNIDAKINEDGIESIHTSGYHRTVSEINSKAKASSDVLGCRIDYKFMKYSFGYNFLRYSYSSPKLLSKYKWKQNEFVGNYNFNTSVDYKFTIDKFFLYGETAICRNKSMAHIIGTNFISDDNVQISVVYRNYEPKFQSDYSNSFGEFHDTNNERGLYLGVEFNPYKNLRIMAYYDRYYFSQARYRISGGGFGYEYLVNLDYLYSSNLRMFFRCKYEMRPLDFHNKTKIVTLNSKKSSYRYTIKQTFSEKLSLAYRIEYSKFLHSKINDSGWLMYLDLIYSSINQKFKIQSRLSYYNTDSYNTRIYAYENDVLYSFSYPSFFNKGSRFYTNIKYNLFQGVYIYIKYALSFKESTLSKNEVTCQLRVRI